MFWALAFPLILGTLFYVSFGNTGLAGTGETDWEPVPVAIVTVESRSISILTRQKKLPKKRSGGRKYPASIT